MNWNYVGIIFAGIVLSVILFFSIYQKNTLPTEHVELSIRNDTVEIMNNDEKLRLEIQRINAKDLEAFKAKYANKELETKQMWIEYEEVLKSRLEKINEIIETKNSLIFSFTKKNYILANKQINIWIIVFIILTSGILGGYARTKYSLLDDLLIVLKQASESCQTATEFTTEIYLTQEPGPINDLATRFHIELETFKSKINKIQNRVEELNKKPKDEKVPINIAFGIIASSLSFLALTTFSSKVLDFQSDIDYFIFMGWCLLGAVFAKNWIKSLYNRITTPSP